MALIPANALNHKLKWSDFKPLDKKEPGEGEFEYAAETSVRLKGVGNPRTGEFKEDGGTVYRFTKVPSIQVIWQPTNWVAKFVFKWDKQHKDDLLDHEQIHYLISALAGRDCDNRIIEIKKTDYDSSEDAIADMDAVWEILSVQDIQKKYDDDTQSLPTDFPIKQKAWATAVRKAHSTGKPLRPTLEAAGLISKN